MTTRKRAQIFAGDGLRARDTGPWAQQKLDFMDIFVPPALEATRTMLTRWYVDLFAGPGLNVMRGGSLEFDGSPLRALELCTTATPHRSFTDAVFVNRDQGDHAALEARVHMRREAGRCRIAEGHVTCRKADANVAIPGIMAAIHLRAYAFVFVDIEAPKQLPFSSVQALRAQGHRSVDLYVLFPLDMGLVRLLSRNPKTVEDSTRTLTDFYGGNEWKALLKYRQTDSRGIGVAAQELYLSKLRELWDYAGEVCDIRKGDKHRLYKMLYASSHPAGQRIAAWAAKRNAPPTLFD